MDAMSEKVLPDSVRDALAAYDAGDQPAREVEKAAVRECLAVLVEVAPGRSVEVRIPPYAAVQAVAGVTHRRGTPSAVVEADPRTWVEMCAGRLAWTDAVARGAVRPSGERSDLSPYLPLW